VQFLSVARGSASEVSAQLYVALDQGYVSKESFGQLQEQATRTGSVLTLPADCSDEGQQVPGGRR